MIEPRRRARAPSPRCRRASSGITTIRRSSTPSVRSSPIRNAAFSSTNFPREDLVADDRDAGGGHAHDLPPQRAHDDHARPPSSEADAREADPHQRAARRRRRGCAAAASPRAIAAPAGSRGTRPAAAAAASRAGPSVQVVVSIVVPSARTAGDLDPVAGDRDAQVVEHALELLHRLDVDRVRARPARIQRRAAAAGDEVAHAVVLGALVDVVVARRTPR